MYPFRFDLVECAEPEFILFWEKRYNEGKYPDEIYEENLNKGRKLQERNIEPLLRWKWGRPLPKAKKAHVSRIIENLSKFNEFRCQANATEEDRKHFWGIVCRIIGSGIVWRVFLLHIARPDDYPIVDQHVLRAANYLTDGRVAGSEQTLENYEAYAAFFRDLCQTSEKESRHVDKALMAFGQFLKSHFFKKPV